MHGVMQTFSNDSQTFKIHRKRHKLRSHSDISDKNTNGQDFIMELKRFRKLDFLLQSLHQTSFVDSYGACDAAGASAAPIFKQSPSMQVRLKVN